MYLIQPSFSHVQRRGKADFVTRRKWREELTPALNLNVRFESISLTYVFTSTIKNRLKDTYQISPKDGIFPEVRGHLLWNVPVTMRTTLSIMCPYLPHLSRR
jgi:hypothetical protein